MSGRDNKDLDEQPKKVTCFKLDNKVHTSKQSQFLLCFVGTSLCHSEPCLPLLLFPKNHGQYSV